MSKLSEKKCVPCEDSSIPPLSCDEAKEMLDHYRTELGSWVMDDRCTQLTWTHICTDFVSAIALVHQIADIAEDAGHHPDISIHYNRVDLILYTHSIKGLSENDFIVAARIAILEN